MDNCLFCKLVRQEIPCDLVYEDDTVFAFRDIQPQAPTHILLVPKVHISSIAKVTDPELVGNLMLRAAELARTEGLEENGYRLVTNHGAHGGQSVFHWHVHLLGGRALGWPPG